VGIGSEIRDFLASGRARLTTLEAGLLPGGCPGCAARRYAVLAQVSTDWYIGLADRRGRT
jgi:hypothetical protein